MSHVTAQAYVTREIQDLGGLFDLLAESAHSVHISRDDVHVVLLQYQVYQEMQRRLEDLEDLLAMQEAEAEYHAGDGRSFDAIVAELEAEEPVYAQIPG